MTEETTMQSPIQDNRSASIDELASALAKAQGAMSGATKASKNPFFDSRYADLASVWDACREPLSENNLSIIQIPGRAQGAVTVETMLAHTSGQWISCTLAATPKDQGPQAVGTVITYLRRYGLAAMVGVAQVDDDGESATEHKPTLLHEQIVEIVDLMKDEGMKKEEIDKWLLRLATRFGVSSHTLIYQENFEKAKDVIINALVNQEKADGSA